MSNLCHFMHFGRGHAPLDPPISPWIRLCTVAVILLSTYLLVAASLMQIFDVTSKEDTTSLSYLAPIFWPIQKRK